VFQTLVFDLAYRAPLQIASTLTAPVPGAAGRDPLGGAERAYGELLADAAAFGQQATQKTDGGGAAEANAAEELVKTARTLFMATVGILAIAIIAIGVLTAAGPVFIALFLFDATRGLFIGWVRALLTVALIPLCAWATTTLMLITLRPGLSRLAAERAAHTLSVDSATAVTAVVTVFAFAQAVLALAALVIATGFRPGRLRPARGSRDRAAPAPYERGSVPIQPTRVDRLVDALQSSAYLERSRHAAAYAAAPAALNRDGPAGAAPDTIRVGQDYRRVRFTDRHREPQA
jgi:type IV secretion system protein VirB6